MSGWFPGKLVGGVLTPDPNAVAEVVTGAPGALDIGPIPDISVALEDSDIHLILSDSSSATGQFGISTGVTAPPALPGSSVSKQPLPCIPELHQRAIFLV